MVTNGLPFTGSNSGAWAVNDAMCEGVPSWTTGAKCQPIDCLSQGLPYNTTLVQLPHPSAPHHTAAHRTAPPKIRREDRAAMAAAARRLSRYSQGCPRSPGRGLKYKLIFFLRKRKLGYFYFTERDCTIVFNILR